MEQNKSNIDERSIYELAYSFDFDMEEYKDFLLDKMKDRASYIFGQVRQEIEKSPRFLSSLKSLKVVDINDNQNESGLKIIFEYRGKEHILVYNLWDMINYPKEHSDSITLIAGLKEADQNISDDIADVVAPYLNIQINDVNHKDALADINTDKSLSTFLSITKKIESLMM